MSSALVGTLKRLNATFELEGIFNIHSNAGMVATSIFEPCTFCDFHTQIAFGPCKEDCDCGRLPNNASWFAVNKATTAAAVKIRSAESKEIIGLLVITDEDAAQKLVSHEIVMREEQISESRDGSQREIDQPDLSFLNEYVGAGLYCNSIQVDSGKVFVSDKIAYFNSDFAFLRVEMPNGEYLGINFSTDEYSDSAVTFKNNEEGDEIDSIITPYAFLFLNVDYIDSLAEQQMYEKDTVDQYYEYFQVSRDFDEMIAFYNYIFSDIETRNSEGIQKPKISNSTECFKLNSVLQMLKNNDGDAVSWMIQGMNDDSDLNEWLKDYLPIPAFVLEAVMPVRGYRAPTEFNLFLPPTLEQVVEGNPTFELFATAAQGVLDWVKENGEHWHVELRVYEDKVTRSWCHDNSNQSWKEIWAGWEPHQKDYQLQVSEETWRSLVSK